MRFAKIDNALVEAESGLKGICPGCGEPVIAKCGEQRIHHFAHLRTKVCDSWWEAETEWHRAWKDNFPMEWQEAFLSDPLTGEKHIADVKTPNSLVIEFQHSHLSSKERTDREKFYQNMVWIVDGTRLNNDYKRFVKGQKFFTFKEVGICNVSRLEDVLSKEWLNSTVPVIFDFNGTGELPDPLGLRNQLHCLFPIRIGVQGVIASLSRNTFIKSVQNGEWLERVTRFMAMLEQEKCDWEINDAKIRMEYAIIDGNRLTRGRHGSNRRF